MIKTWQKIQTSSNDFNVLAAQICPNETVEEQLRALAILSMVNSVLARDTFAYAFMGAFIGLSTGEDLTTNYDVAEYVWQATDTTQTLLILNACMEQLANTNDTEYLPSLTYLGGALAEEGLRNGTAFNS